MRQVVAEELTLIDDDALGLVTVTGVETEPDLRHATVWLSSMDEGAKEALARHRVRLQAAIGRQVRLKRTPELRFQIDPAVEAGTRVEEILRRLGQDGER